MHFSDTIETLQNKLKLIGSGVHKSRRCAAICVKRRENLYSGYFQHLKMQNTSYLIYMYTLHVHIDCFVRDFGATSAA